MKYIVCTNQRIHFAISFIIFREQVDYAAKDSQSTIDVFVFAVATLLGE